MARQIELTAAKALAGVLILVLGAFGHVVFAHVLAEGHPVTIERLERLQADVGEIKVDVKILLRNGKKYAAVTP